MTNPDVVRAEAQRLATVLSAVDQMRYVHDQLGPRVTAAALGLVDARPLRRWMEGELDGLDQEAVSVRLRILYQIVFSISMIFGPAAASAFIRSENPRLNDEAALILLRDDNPVQHEKAILAAARAFIEE